MDGLFSGVLNPAISVNSDMKSINQELIWFSPRSSLLINIFLSMEEPCSLWAKLISQCHFLFLKFMLHTPKRVEFFPLLFTSWELNTFTLHRCGTEGDLKFLQWWYCVGPVTIGRDFGIDRNFEEGVFFYMDYSQP